MKTIQLAPNLYEGGEGSFSTLIKDNGSVGWQHCRDEFHNKHWTYKRDGNCHGFIYRLIANQNINDIAKIVSEIENNLKLKSAQKCEFSLTQFKNIVYCNPNWWHDPVRHTLLTSIIKGAINTNTVEGVKGSKYLMNTKTAFDRFLDGNCHYQGNFFEGWVKTMSVSPEKLGKKPNQDPVVQIQYYHFWPIHVEYLC